MAHPESPPLLQWFIYFSTFLGNARNMHLLTAFFCTFTLQLSERFEACAQAGSGCISSALSAPLLLFSVF